MPEAGDGISVLVAPMLSVIQRRVLLPTSLHSRFKLILFAAVSL